MSVRSCVRVLGFRTPNIDKDQQAIVRALKWAGGKGMTIRQIARLLTYPAPVRRVAIEYTKLLIRDLRDDYPIAHTPKGWRLWYIENDVMEDIGQELIRCRSTGLLKEDTLITILETAWSARSQASSHYAFAVMQLLERWSILVFVPEIYDKQCYYHYQLIE